MRPRGHYVATHTHPTFGLDVRALYIRIAPGLGAIGAIQPAQEGRDRPGRLAGTAILLCFEAAQ